MEVGPYSLKAPITRQKLQMTIGAAFDRKNQLEQLGDPEYKMRIEKGKKVTTGDRVSFWIARRYLLMLNLFMLLYVGLPFLAPTLMKLGANCLPGPSIVCTARFAINLVFDHSFFMESRLFIRWQKRMWLV